MYVDVRMYVMKLNKYVHILTMYILMRLLFNIQKYYLITINTTRLPLIHKKTAYFINFSKDIFMFNTYKILYYSITYLIKYLFVE